MKLDQSQIKFSEGRGRVGGSKRGEREGKVVLGDEVRGGGRWVGRNEVAENKCLISSKSKCEKE